MPSLSFPDNSDGPTLPASGKTLKIQFFLKTLGHVLKALDVNCLWHDEIIKIWFLLYFKSFLAFCSYTNQNKEIMSRTHISRTHISHHSVTKLCLSSENAKDTISFSLYHIAMQKKAMSIRTQL